MSTKTPRTDAAAQCAEIVHQDSHTEEWVDAEFARELETALSRVTEERDAALRQLRTYELAGKSLRESCGISGDGHDLTSVLDWITEHREAARRVEELEGKPCASPRFVYVVATGGFRVAVESDIPLGSHSAFKAALPRFETIGCSLGSIIEITECSDFGDPGNPFYIETISALKMLGKLSDGNTSPASAEKEGECK